MNKPPDKRHWNFHFIWCLCTSRFYVWVWGWKKNHWSLNFIEMLSRGLCFDFLEIASPGWPRTHCADPAGFRLAALSPLSHRPSLQLPLVFCFFCFSVQNLSNARYLSWDSVYCHRGIKRSMRLLSWHGHEVIQCCYKLGSESTGLPLRFPGSSVPEQRLAPQTRGWW